ncbi:hypothetical protein HMPREF9440_01498 [Sutterella parvirubra YIT 11816]|uniref:Uncharacterized protein n=1 Tax=Sutterella parvirubra YIT 11816 TaxID=762967 RepID=H3KFI1_9BURK|nr:hypothetical protein HMPREF9440_01498 [Sutterella parvirubra YIT 11816]
MPTVMRGAVDVRAFGSPRTYLVFRAPAPRSARARTGFDLRASGRLREADAEGLRAVRVRWLR